MCFRISSAERAAGNATRFLKSSRDRTQLPGDRYLTTTRVESQPVTGETILRACCGIGSDTENAPVAFSKLVNELGTELLATPGPNHPDVRDLVPGDAPLLDKLYVKSLCNGAWKYPTPNELKKITTSRQTTDGWMDSSTTRFVYTFQKDSEELLQSTLRTVMRLYAIDERVWPGSIAAMKATCMYVSEEDFCSLLSPASRGSEVSFTAADKNAPGTVSMPTKIVVAGSTWSITFQLPITRSVIDDTFSMTNFELPFHFCQFMYSLQSVAVSDILDATMIEAMCRRNGDEKFAFNGVVDVETLAVLAGLRKNCRDITVLSYVTTGALCYSFNNPDAPVYSQPWSSIDDSIKLELIKEAHIIHRVYRILSLTFIWELFPDPCIATTLTRSTTAEFMTWFITFLNHAINRVTINRNVDLEKTMSRKEMVQTLYAISMDHKPGNNAPARLILIVSLLSDWPTVSYGGARFLSQGREHFMSQLSLIHI